MTTTTESQGAVDENARRRFEEAWRQGRPQPIEQFLPPEDHSNYLATLEELVQIELEFAWKARGESSTVVGGAKRAPCVENYLARFLCLNQPPILVRLLQQEFRVRHDYGDRPSPQEYHKRFPKIIASGREVEGSLPGSESPADVPQIPGYVSLGLLGRGGMGVVHRGRDPDLGRDVAVKVLLAEHRDEPDFVRRFLNEARINGQLQHPNVVPVHEMGWLADGRPFFTMKLVQGRTLATLLKERVSPGNDLPRFLTIFEQVCQALAHAHAQRVIHRDLKPANVMVGGFGEVQVMDWGLAKALPQRDTTDAAGLPVGTGPVDLDLSEQATLIRTAKEGATPDGSRAGHAVGTPAFMPPEQAKGQIEQIDERADVFGLGGILCVILTGQPPYVGRDLSEVIHLASSGAIEAAFARLDVCGADVELVRLCKECLLPALEARPADAGMVAGRVTAYQAGVRERLRQAELERTAAQVKAVEERKRRRLAVGLAAAVLSLVVVGGGAGVWLQQQRAEQRQGVEMALDKLPGVLRQGRWQEAGTVLDEAESRLGKTGLAGLRERAAQARADLNLAVQLDGIRQKRAALVDGKLNDQSMDQEYTAAFRATGLWQEGEDEEVVAGRVRASAIRGHLLAALDDWASVPLDRSRRTFLLGVAGKAGSDDWAVRFHDPNVWWDRDALRKLLNEAKVEELSPQLLTSVGVLMRWMQMDPVPWWTAAQGQHPNDFWLNYNLGIALRNAKQPGKAVGYYRAALAVRPDSVAAHITLGNALTDQGQLDEALQAYRRALDLDPNVALAQDNLGVALMAKGQLDEAITAHRRAIELDPKHAPAHSNLGHALDAKGQTDEALKEYRLGVTLDSRNVTAHNNLGMLLLKKRQTDEAIEEFRRALELDPKLATVHVNLGLAHMNKGQRQEAITAFRRAVDVDPANARAFAALGTVLAEQRSFFEARAAFQRCHDLSREGTGLHQSALQHLRQLERPAAMDEKLAALLKGDAQSADADERLVLARFCLEQKRLFVPAARLYKEAFSTHPELSRVITAGHRYYAACAAALAGCGQGDGGPLDDQARAGLRRQ
jgi:serine/threonine-protein kinase